MTTKTTGKTKARTPRPLTRPQQDLATSCYHLAHKVATLLARRLPAGSSADDLAGECLRGVCRAARSFDPAAGAKFSTYAWRGALNHGIAHIRKELEQGLRGFAGGARAGGPRKRPVVFSGYDGKRPPDANPESELRAVTLIDFLTAREDPQAWWDDDDWRTVLAAVPKVYRPAVDLVHRQGLPPKDAAAALDISVTRINQQLQAAYAFVRKNKPNLAKEL